MNPSSSWEGNQPCENQGDLCHRDGLLMIFFFKLPAEIAVVSISDTVFW